MCFLFSQICLLCLFLYISFIVILKYVVSFNLSFSPFFYRLISFFIKLALSSSPICSSHSTHLFLSLRYSTFYICFVSSVVICIFQLLVFSALLRSSDLSFILLPPPSHIRMFLFYMLLLLLSLSFSEGVEPVPLTRPFPAYLTDLSSPLLRFYERV